ncbi:MAG: hypothetical protein N4J56_002181 [Chroococcidiopsis sp. SAG 2025]|uniref:hypothetical protein n=1 Tax=Chroococcidiopsis sp. SAG 2025 TaxID=171389 RepID=UPI0029370096|nr:hypothetical protein [Chroococcidiopsis sp. SAG 2025]MDV2992527.1 hypothetical protein [Chroococcidiopsis sp. SAG 2025]
MNFTTANRSIATRLCNCDRYRVTIVSEQLELEAREMPVPVECQTIEVEATKAKEIPALVALSHPGYKVVDSWQPIEIEEECPF